MGIGIGDVASGVANALRDRAEELENVAKALEVLSAGMAYAGRGDVDSVVQGVVLKLLGVDGAGKAPAVTGGPLESHRSCEVNRRSLAQEQTVVVFAGPVSLGRTLVVGLSTEGKRRILGLFRGTCADALAMKAAVDDLYTRGLGVREGPDLLWVTDGSRAIEEAVRQAWTGARIALCRTTLEDHVLHAVSEASRSSVRRTLRGAFAQGDLREAEASLAALERRLTDAFPGASEILARGRQASILLKGFGLPPVLERHLATLATVRTADAQARALGRPHTPAGEDSLPYGVEAWEKATRRVVGYEHMPALVEALSRRSQDAA